MIYTDGTHIISDASLEELHVFARKIGLKRQWFQNHRHPHYDTTTKRKSRLAVENGAVVCSTRELVSIIRLKSVLYKTPNIGYNHR